MKKLKYLLIAILFAAFAGEGFGQDSYIELNIIDGTTTFSSTISNPTTLSCNPSSQLKLEVSLYYGPDNWFNHVDANNNLKYNRYRVIIERKVNGGSWSFYKCTYNALPAMTQFTGATATSTINIDRIDAKYRVKHLQIALSFTDESDCNSLYANGGTMSFYNYIPGEIDGAATSQPSSTFSSTLNGIVPSSNYKVTCEGSPITLNNISACNSDQYAIYVYRLNQNGNTITSKTTGALGGLPNSSIDLLSTNPFIGFFQLNYKYKIVLKTGLLGNWPSSNINTFYIDLRKNYTTQITISPTNQTICLGQSATLTVSGFSPINGSLDWNGNNQSTGLSTPIITVSPNVSTVYTVTFSDICTQDPPSKTVIVNPPPTIDLSSNITEYCVNAIPLNTWNAVANVYPPGGTGSWSSQDWNITGSTFNPSSNFIPAVGDMTYTYTDANGCSNSASFTFGYYDPATISGTVDNVTCLGSQDGAIFPVATGQPNFVYSLNGNTQTPPYLNLSGGSYDVEVIDGRGCISNNNFVVTEATTALSTGTPSISDETCMFSNNGEITISPTGGVTPYAINWSNGATGTTNTGMAPGTYSVTVTDANGCEDITTGMQVNAANTGIVLGTPGTTTNSSCVGVCDGSSSFSTAIFGSSTNYTYTWNDGVTGTNPAGAPVTHANMCSGNYSVTVTDASGCTSSASVSITDGPSNWHKNTQNITYNDDDEIKRVLTDANGDVYVLGEFTGTTELDGSSFSSGSQSPVGIFLAKYTNCGNLRWYVYSDMGSGNYDVEAVDIDFDNSGNIILFAQVLTGQPLFQLIDQNNQPVNVNAGNNSFFYASVDTFSGDLGTVSTVLSSVIAQSDKVNAAKINGSDYYFAGQFSSKAGVIKNSTSVFTENSTGNEIVDIEIWGNTLFAIANISSSTSFGSTPNTVLVPNNGGQEGVILEYDLSTSTYGSIIPAHGNDVTLKDLALDKNNDVWVVGQFSDAIQGWSTLTASQKTALIMQFDASLSPLSSYYSNPQASNQSVSSADAIGSFTTSGSTVNAIYIAGTFNGNDMNLDGTSGTFQTTGGSGTSNDLWLAQFNLAASSGVSTVHWVHASSSLEDVTVNALAFDNINAFVVGSYKADIILPPNMVLQHMAQGTAFGYIIRGGDIFGAPSYYKTGGSSANESNTEDPPISALESTAFSLYPNPNNGIFTIDYRSETTGIVLISVYDVTGRQLMQQQAVKESTIFTHSLTLTQFTKGVYVLRLEVNGNSLYQKFIVE